MCAPVLSLPRHNAMYGMRDGAATWRAGNSDGGYPMQHYAAQYGGVLGMMPHCPFGGIQATGSWGVTEWGCSGIGTAASPILATSPSNSRKPGGTHRPGHQRPQPTVVTTAASTLIPGLQQRPNGGWEHEGFPRPAQPHNPRHKRRSGPAHVAVHSPRTSEQDQPNTARSSFVDTASGCDDADFPAQLSLKPPLCEDAGDLYGPESPVRVRNTFLDSPLERSPSLEKFFEERKVRSCPASGPHSRQGSNSSLFPAPISEDEEEADNEAVAASPSGSNSTWVTPRAGCTPRKPMTTGHEAGSGSQLPPLARRDARTPDALAAAAAVQLAKDFETRTWDDGAAAELLSTPPTGVEEEVSSNAASSTMADHHWCSRPTSEASGSGAIPFSARQAAAGTAAGADGSAASTGAGTGFTPAASADASSRQAAKNASELPSKGSALHTWGACKPCAFVFEAGCTNGTECQFCHLCEPGEKKRRKKERRRLAKDNQQAS